MVPQILFPLLFLAALLAAGFLAQLIAPALWLIFSNDLDVNQFENVKEPNENN